MSAAAAQPSAAASTTRRVVEFRWLPRTDEEWATFGAARLESARLWARMVAIHARIRRAKWTWPKRAQWERWARGKSPALSAHSVQQTVADFCDAIVATTRLRKAQRRAGLEVTARYPWKTRNRYRDVVYANDDAVVRRGVLTLPHGRYGGKLRITLPADRPLPGRVMEAQLGYGRVRVVCEVAAAPVRADAPTIGVDLGVNTLLAATDGATAVLVSGRAAKAVVRYRNKANAVLRSRIDQATRGSKRRKRLVRARYRMTDRCDRTVRDLLHKATRKIADAFPGSRAVVGKPFNDAARTTDRVRAQQVSQASNARLVAQLAYKLAGATQVPEPYSSQTCPGCGCRQKCRRVYQCKDCGFTAPRDVVGALNIRSIGLHGEIRAGQPPPPPDVRFVRPLRKYPAAPPRRDAAGRPGGTPARVAA